ncbi:hypothetical protein JWG42_17455 [Desulfoprunum benzoelyticum]|uniref:Putative PurR-regulated permease PerM n=1 Tax=Desulfoprunum benzoelyticum TaxID=1506996 RepID=A0A840UUA4_9BACT|nr:hypothetical protein [Desulfoprunum benzoelyticum]MBB5349777.1 putative PurR-regulated permease PerM [Desulfoprunum benzoelyticum]MBM9531944.1 hypothetical protein [Desulfoprunum benzoelyticum]
MKKDEFRTPLLQSGIVITVMLVFFAFVVSSKADGIGSGFAAIISGILHSILFSVGLIVSIILSISLLICLFLAAMALYSFDKAKEIFLQLQTVLLNSTEYLAQIITHRKNNHLRNPSHDKAKIEQLENQLVQASEQNQQLLLTIDHLTKEIESLRSTENKKDTDQHKAPPVPEASTI